MNSFLESLTLANLSGLLLGFAALITAIVGGRKNKADATNAQAAAVKAYAEASEIATKQNQGLQDRINTLETKVDELLRVIRSKDGRIKELEELTQEQQCEIDKLRQEVAELRKQIPQS
jgi:chromosome segregation ATPase